MKKEGLKNNVYVQYTILFSAVFMIAFLPFVLRGNGLVSEADGFNQSYPVFVYVRQYVEDFLKGNINLFDFRIGLGDDVIASLSYYGAFDVLNVLLALIFPKELSGVAYNLGTMLRFYFCGIAFIVYIRRYIQSKEICIAGALLYSINIYALRWGLYLSFFITPMITFPLILAGVDYLCEDKHKCSGLMLSGLFLQGINGFYFLYQEIILTIIYFGVIAVFRLYRKLDYKELLEKVWVVGINGILGVCAGGGILVPSIYGFLNSTRSGISQLPKRIFVGINELLTNFGNLFMPNMYVSISTLSVITVLGWIILLYSKNVKTEFKVISIVTYTIYWSPIVRSIMNGFSYDSTRWFGFVSFFVVVATALAMEAEVKISKNITYFFWMIVVASIIVHVVQNPKTIGLVIRVGVFGIFAILIPLVWNCNDKREKKLLICSSLIAAAMGLFALGPKVLGGSGYSAGFKTTKVYEEIRNSIEGIEKKNSTFERWDIYDSSLEATLVLDYYGTSEYLSILNQYVSEFYQEMDISSGVRAASNILRGLDARKELEVLLSVTQYMDYTVNDNGELERVIIENKDYLPLGYVYDSYMLRSEFDTLDPLQKESALLDTVVLEEKIEGANAYKVSERNQNKELSFEVIEKEGKIKVYPEFDYYEELINKQGELYVLLDQFEGNAEVYVGNRNVQVRDRSFLYYIGKNEYWFNVTELQKDEAGYYFNVYIDGGVNFETANMHIYWHEINYNGVEERKKNVLHNLKVAGDYISGNISCSENELLFFSVPYSKGWKAYVDGEPVEVYQSDIGFLSILPGEGEHYIELKYVTPGLVVGMIISVSSLFGFCLFHRSGKIRRRS